MEKDPRKQSLVRAIVAMAHGLGIKVTAEGIESPEHETFLQSLGCHNGQGYLYAKPLPSSDVLNFIRKQHH